MTQIAEKLVTPQTKRGLAHLKYELLSLERGEAPSMDSILQAIEEVLWDPIVRHKGELIDLCQRLTCYLEELREDELELSLDDLDVLFDGLDQLHSMQKGELLATNLVQQIERPSQEAIPMRMLLTSNETEVLTSGILKENRSSITRVTLPAMDTKQAEDAVFEDIATLLDHSDRAIEIDCLGIERIPASLIARLVNKSRTDVNESPRIGFLAGFAEIQSVTLHETLSLLFRLN